MLSLTVVVSKLPVTVTGAGDDRLVFVHGFGDFSPCLPPLWSVWSSSSWQEYLVGKATQFMAEK